MANVDMSFQEILCSMESGRADSQIDDVLEETGIKGDQVGHT